MLYEHLNMEIIRTASIIYKLLRRRGRENREKHAEGLCFRLIKEARSVTINILSKKYFLFKSFVKIELSYVFTINMFSTTENCMEK